MGEVVASFSARGCAGRGSLALCQRRIGKGAGVSAGLACTGLDNWPPVRRQAVADQYAFAGPVIPECEVGRAGWSACDHLWTGCTEDVVAAHLVSLADVLGRV